MNEVSESKPRWYSKSEQWKIIPWSLVLVGIERSLTGLNLLLSKEVGFGTPILVIGLFVTIFGAILLNAKNGST